MSHSITRAVPRFFSWNEETAPTESSVQDIKSRPEEKEARPAGRNDGLRARLQSVERTFHQDESIQNLLDRATDNDRLKLARKIKTMVFRNAKQIEDYVEDNTDMSPFTGPILFSQEELESGSETRRLINVTRTFYEYSVKFLGYFANPSDNFHSLVEWYFNGVGNILLVCLSHFRSFIARELMMFLSTGFRALIRQKNAIGVWNDGLDN